MPGYGVSGVQRKRPSEAERGRRGGGEGAEEGKELLVGVVEGEVVVVAGEGEEGVGGDAEGVGGLDADEKRGVGVGAGVEEGREVVGGEGAGPCFVVRAEQEGAVAVELEKDAGELGAQVAQVRKEILLDREVAAGEVRGDLLGEDVDDPVGFVLRFQRVTR